MTIKEVNQKQKKPHFTKPPTQTSLAIRLTPPSVQPHHFHSHTVYYSNKTRKLPTPTSDSRSSVIILIGMLALS